MRSDPKRTAAAILSLAPGDEDSGEVRADDEDEDTEAPALEAAASELMEAFEAKDAGAMARALRAAFHSMGR